VTVARTAPKKTISELAVVLNPDPVIVTVVPTGPEAGEKELITGWAKEALSIQKNKEIKSRKAFG
jgi:hypothetical protein